MNTEILLMEELGEFKENKATHQQIESMVLMEAERAIAKFLGESNKIKKQFKYMKESDF